MKFETILGLGVLGIIAYFIYKFTNSATTQHAVTTATNAIENAATGQLSDSQVNEQIALEAHSLVTAGVPADQAIAQATRDQQALQTQQSDYPCTFWNGISSAFDELIGEPGCTSSPVPATSSAYADINAASFGAS